MKLSSKTRYGLRACHILGRAYPSLTVSATVLESKIGVSGKYIEKIMRLLAQRDIVVAVRGVSGGYQLAREPKDITIGEIVRALEDDMEIVECVKADGKCKCCPSSMVWKKFYQGMNQLLDGMNVEQMIKGEL